MEAALNIRDLLGSVPATEEERIQRRNDLLAEGSEASMEAFGILSQFSCEEEDEALYTREEVAAKLSDLLESLT